MQHRCRVGGIAHDHEVGVVGDGSDDTGADRLGRFEKDLTYRDPGRPENQFGLGERRLEQGRMTHSEPRQQFESVGRPGQQHDLVGATAMQVRDQAPGLVGRVLCRVPGQIVDTGLDGRADESRWPAAHVDREVEQPGAAVLVAVPVQRMQPRCHTDRAYVHHGSVMSRPDPTHIDPADPATILLVDLDGTITDSVTGIVNSFRYALTQVGAPPPPDDVVAGIVGPPMIDTLRLLGLDDATADTAMRAYRARYTDLGWLENSVFDGMADVLADLAAAGRTLALATSKNQVVARAILDHFSLSTHFQVIAGAAEDDTRRHKSDVIAYALAQLDQVADPRNRRGDRPVVMIGDRSHDVDGAAHFGIPTVIVGWGYSLPGERDAAAWSVDSIPDLREVLGV